MAARRCTAQRATVAMAAPDVSISDVRLVLSLVGLRDVGDTEALDGMELPPFHSVWSRSLSLLSCFVVASSVRNKYAVRISCHASCGDLFTLSLCFNLTKTTKSAACLDTRHGGGEGSREIEGNGGRNEKLIVFERPLDALMRAHKTSNCRPAGQRMLDKLGVFLCSSASVEERGWVWASLEGWEGKALWGG